MDGSSYRNTTNHDGGMTTMMGYSSRTAELEALLERQMEEILQVLDDDLKQEYLVALETVPELVKAETPRLNFLRTDDYHPMKACRRLALYWKHRRDVFGEDRWLLHMNQTESGALSSSTIEVIRSGCLWIVVEPNDPAVVVVDFSRIERQLTEADALEWLFYFGTVFSNPTTQTAGVAIVHRIAEGQRFQMIPGLYEVSRSAMPFQFRPAIIISTLDESKSLLAEFLIHQTVKMVEYNQRSTPTILQAPNVESRLQLLEQQGIPRHCLPTTLGGTLDEEYWQNWIRTRIGAEDLMGSIVRNQASMAQDKPSNVARARAIITTGVTEEKPAKANKSASEGKDGKRRRNAIHHQRWLQKQVIRRNALHEKNKLEKNRNAQLKALNDKLTDLLAQAQYIVAVHTSNTNLSSTSSIGSIGSIGSNDSNSPQRDDT